jgi:hypothetical protein
MLLRVLRARGGRFATRAVLGSVGMRPEQRPCHLCNSPETKTNKIRACHSSGMQRDALSCPRRRKCAKKIWSTLKRSEMHPKAVHCVLKMRVIGFFLQSPVCSHMPPRKRGKCARYIETTSAVICDGDLIPHVDCVLCDVVRNPYAAYFIYS